MCSLSTATRSPIAPTTRCRRRCAVPRGSRAMRSSAFRTSSCACGRQKSLARSSSAWDSLTAARRTGNELFAELPGRAGVRRRSCLEQLDRLPELVRCARVRPRRRSDGLRGRRLSWRLPCRAEAGAREQARSVVVDRGSGRRSSWRATRSTLLLPTRGVSELARVGPDGGARALRRRAGAGARLHRAPRRPLGSSCRVRVASARPRRPRILPAQYGIARGDARGRPVRGAGGGTAAVSANGDSGRLRPPTSPRRPDP